MATLAVVFGALSWIPFSFGIASGMAIPLGYEAFRAAEPGDGAGRVRWLASIGIQMGILGLGWVAFFSYEVGACPGNPGTLGVSSLVVGGTFAAPPLLAAAAMAAAVHSGWGSGLRVWTATLLLIAAGAAAFWAVILVATAGMGECF